MYLTKHEIEKVVGNVIQGCENEDFPFEASQIRTCSIDIRVDNIFWKARKFGRTKLDLGFTRIYSIRPTRRWVKVVLKKGQTIDLKPDEMLLGRTYEKICLPDNLIGKINTRSSYARLGISTNCNCDLINPGYSGHVPMELVNETKSTIVIHPYLPLSQIFLMKPDGLIDSSYASPAFESMYVDDDGGPSLWWKDRLVKKISEINLRSELSNDLVEQISSKFESIPPNDDKALDRLEKFLGQRRFSNFDELVFEFTKEEKRRSILYKLRKVISILAFPLLAGTLLTEATKFNSNTADSFSYVILIGCIMSIVPFLYYSISSNKTYYTGLDR